MTRAKTLLLGAGIGALLAAVAVCVWAYREPFEARQSFFDIAVRVGGARRIQVNGLTGYLRDTCEQGRPCRCVALIHGLGDTALTWRTLLRDDSRGRVPAGYRLLAFNLPGTSGSAAPDSPGGYALRAQAATLAESLPAMCPESRWTVVGNSLGGWIAGWLAVQNPELVERLVLVDAAGVRDPSGMTELAGRTLARPTPESLKVFAARAHHRPRRMSDRLWRKMAERLGRSTNVAVLKTVTDDDWLDEAAKGIRAPTEIIWGLSDGVLPLEIGRRYKKLISGATLRTIQACGHLPHNECPTVVRWVLFGREAVY